MLSNLPRLTILFLEITWLLVGALFALPSYSINFVKRDANSMAHEIARVSRSYENSFCWIDPPSFVVGLPYTSCGCINKF